MQQATAGYVALRLLPTCPTAAAGGCASATSSLRLTRLSPVLPHCCSPSGGSCRVGVPWLDSSEQRVVNDAALPSAGRRGEARRNPFAVAVLVVVGLPGAC